MVDFSNLGDYLEDDKVPLEGIKSESHPEGKTYYINSPSAMTGLRLAAMGDIILRASQGFDIDERATARLKLDDGEEAELIDDLMGDTKTEMIEDGVSWAALRGIMQYLFIYFAIGKDKAEAAARNGIFSGKAPEPENRAARRKKPTTRKAPAASAGSSKAKAKPKSKG